MLSLPAVS